MNPFRGCMPALMTPCDASGSPDYDALVATGRDLMAAGMSAVIYCGSMGDWPLLTDAQRQEGVAGRRWGGGRFPIERRRPFGRRFHLHHPRAGHFRIRGQNEKAGQHTRHLNDGVDRLGGVGPPEHDREVECLVR